MVCVSVEVALYVKIAATKVIFSQAYSVYHSLQRYRKIDMGDGPGELVDFQGSPPTALEWSSPTCRKASKDGRRPTCMNKELLTKLRHKNEAHKRWKQGQVTPNMEMLSESAGMPLGKLEPSWS